MTKNGKSLSKKRGLGSVGRGQVRPGSEGPNSGGPVGPAGGLEVGAQQAPRLLVIFIFVNICQCYVIICCLSAQVYDDCLKVSWSGVQTGARVEGENIFLCHFHHSLGLINIINIR